MRCECGSMVLSVMKYVLLADDTNFWIHEWSVDPEILLHHQIKRTKVIKKLG